MAYADDLVLMSPTKLGLEKIIEVCQRYSKEYQKSKFKMGDAELTYMSSVEHLGHRLFGDIRCTDTNGITTKFYRQFNSFRCKFGNFSPEIQSELFIKYCSSFYGALLQNFKSIEKLCVVWRKALRQIWKLPYRTHCDIVACLTDMPCARHMFMQRMLKMGSFSKSRGSQ